ncbi:hypothetical protein [Salinicoccus carnicancri]|uniref:hypothetical protein n=1 Tax=Salinicoccus carnicancri TaxID=558170 RepID=UPI0002D8B0A9|nr:hypothetical protein [Salinicoccus carnicancri]
MDKEIDTLMKDAIDTQIVKERLKDTDVKTYSVEKATGVNLDDITLDENDGCE